MGRAIDKAAGVEREVVGQRVATGTARKSTTHTGIGAAVSNKAEPRDYIDTVVNLTAPATPDAERWQGWGTALKPAHEPIVVARKPLSGNVAANVLAHGTGALNIDGCRVAGDEDGSRNRPASRLGSSDTYAQDEWTRTAVVERQDTTGKGRWPANVVLDESQAAVLDAMSGQTRSSGFFTFGEGDFNGPASVNINREGYTSGQYDDQGGASRFFYVAKAGASERPRVNGISHPTTKPLTLMRYLARLVTPPGGTVLEPFAGSGTTVEACILEGFRCIAIEREADYLPLIVQRITRRRDPVAAVKSAGTDGGLFDLLDGGVA
ncbi:MAG: DNA methyltransferase [Mycobacteriales bacterium]